ncbi:MAG: hypothetical protein SVR94_02160 [Pseudomonadota bacterium]|nr:hypothetical protein [Pseudomonadota bacterium]
MNPNVFAGARWWKFDFHTHTPASNDYRIEITPQDWLLDFMRAQIDCVAVTDHNSGVWIDILKQALETLRDNDNYRPLFLFPGIEITAHGNIHILAIFNADKRTSDIDTLLGAVEYSGTKGQSDGCTTKSPLQVIEEIVKADGLAIPAHVDKPKGLFKVQGNSLKQVLNCNKIITMELCNADYEKPQLYNDEKLNWVEVLGSDAHHPAPGGEKHPGSHYTWIKMDYPPRKVYSSLC